MKKRKLFFVIKASSNPNRIGKRKPAKINFGGLPISIEEQKPAN